MLTCAVCLYGIFKYGPITIDRLRWFKREQDRRNRRSSSWLWRSAVIVNTYRDVAGSIPALRTFFVFLWNHVYKFPDFRLRFIHPPGRPHEIPTELVIPRSDGTL